MKSSKTLLSLSVAVALTAAGTAATAQNTAGGLFEVIKPAPSVNLGMVELGKKALL